MRGCPAIAGNAHSLAFDGRATYVDVAHADGLNTERALTVACWVKLDVVKSIRQNHSFVAKQSRKQRRGGRETPGDRGGWALWMGQGKPAVAGYDEITFTASEGPGCGPDMYLTTVDADLVANSWYHVAVTWSANGPLRIYKNGEEMRTTTFQNYRRTLPKIQSTVGPVWLGTVERMPRSFHSLDGQLDDVRIYDRALSAVEIAALAAGGGKTGNPRK